MQNMLAACDFNLYFTFVLPGYTMNTHDNLILANAIHNAEILVVHTPRKYYLVDSEFAHQPGYMVFGYSISFPGVSYGADRQTSKISRCTRMVQILSLVL